MRWSWAAAVATFVVAAIAFGAVLRLSASDDRGPASQDLPSTEDAGELPGSPDDGATIYRFDQGEKGRYRGYFCGEENVEGPSPRPVPTCTPPSGRMTPLTTAS